MTNTHIASTGVLVHRVEIVHADEVVKVEQCGNGGPYQQILVGRVGLVGTGRHADLRRVALELQERLRGGAGEKVEEEQHWFVSVGVKRINEVQL